MQVLGLADIYKEQMQASRDVIKNSFLQYFGDIKEKKPSKVSLPSFRSNIN